MISWFVTQASSYAPDVDGLILLVAVIIAPFFLAAEFILIWLVFRFRARPGVKARYITGEKASETRWVSYPHYLVLVFDVIIVVAALRVWSDVKMELPTADERVRIIAQQWAWTFVHAGADGQLDTADDIRTVNELNLQVNRLYHYELHSKDVLHSLSVPAFRLKQDAVPGREIVGWFRPTVAGEFDIQCAEICGIGHGLMPARVRIRSAAAQAAWMETAPQMPLALSERSESNGPAAATPAVAATSGQASLAPRPSSGQAPRPGSGQAAPARIAEESAGHHGGGR